MGEEAEPQPALRAALDTAAAPWLGRAVPKPGAEPGGSQPPGDMLLVDWDPCEYGQQELASELKASAALQPPSC